MKFVVSRTSQRNYDEKPCEEAYKDKITYVDVRTISEEEYNSKFITKWKESGYNHRILKNGYIARDLGITDCWFIDINSIEEILSFKEKYGNLVITESYKNSDYLEIEIYDDHRE